jgi:hypothetical protein
MAEWLSRPMLTEVHEAMLAPNPAVDDSGNGQPSPILNLCEQSKLVRALTLRFGRLAELERRDHMREAVDLIEQWAKRLPPQLGLEGQADHGFDRQCTWLPLQRASLRCFAYMARLTPLKQVLKKDCPDVEDLELKALAARLCVDCIDAGLALHKLLKPSRRSFHFVIFVLFDTATVVCSALLHDRQQCSLDHSHLLQKAEEAQAALEALAQDAQSAMRSADILRWLLEVVYSSQPESRPAEVEYEATVRSDSSGQNDTLSTIAPPHSPTDPTLLSSQAMVDTSPFQISKLEDSSWDCLPLDLALDDLPDLDLGGIESIWDWEALDLTPATGVW